MKKIILLVLFLMAGLLICILGISYTKHIEKELHFYTIPRNLTYVFDEATRMEFDIYINAENNIIEFPTENHYEILNEKNSYPLEEVKVVKHMDCVENAQNYYIYTISAKMLDCSQLDLILPQAKLKIENAEFQLECCLGFLGIYRNHELLEFHDLYGNYAYIEDELHMVGVTIQLPTAYKHISSVCVGTAYGNLEYMEMDHLYDSQMDFSTLKHKVLKKEDNKIERMLYARQGYYFIPLSYSELFLTTNACILFKIDEHIFCLENFLYLANSISLKNYKVIRQEGIISYA